MDSSDEYEYDDDDNEYVYEDENDIDDYHDDKESGYHDETNTAKHEDIQSVPHDGYVIKPASEILPLFFKLIRDTAYLLGVSFDEAQAFLRYTKWDKEKLFDQYFSNPEKIREDIGLSLYFPINELPQSNTTFKCRICYMDDCDPKDSFALGCNHRFCFSCFGEYLRNQLPEGPNCILSCCPEYKCKCLVTSEIFKHFLSKEDFEKYQTYFLKNFIERSRSMRYCPAANCDKVAIGSGVTAIRCSCSSVFCFRCGEEAHDPSSCSQLSTWNEKCANESETANWILANTRKCPQCQTRIEKNQGCNHMTCKLCKHEFCWICMESWEKHSQNTGGFYKCNRYNSKEVQDLQSAADKAKAELDRYLHYYRRYQGHNQALSYAVTQRLRAQKNMKEQQEKGNTSWLDVQFLQQATEQVIDCRRVLKYTYVLGYFLPDDTLEKRLFEYHQEMLESNTEKLHECTEKPIDQLDRAQVVNLTRVTEKFLSSLMQNMGNGLVRMDDSHGNLDAMPKISPLSPDSSNLSKSS